MRFWQRAAMVAHTTLTTKWARTGCPHTFTQCAYEKRVHVRLISGGFHSGSLFMADVWPQEFLRALLFMAGISKN